MKILSIYENLIREEGISSQTEKCVKLFGKELFSPQFGGDEPNSNFEDSAVTDIFNFTLTGYGRFIDQDFINSMKQLKSCVSVYPEILHPEGEVYRGTKTTLGAFLNMKYNPQRWNKYNYKANTIVQSWTETFEVANDFAANSVDRYTLDMVSYILKGNHNDLTTLLKENGDFLYKNFKIPLILKHNATPDQFLFKAKYFNMLSQAGANVDSREDEILRIDNRELLTECIIPEELESDIIGCVRKLQNHR